MVERLELVENFYRWIQLINQSEAKKATVLGCLSEALVIAVVSSPEGQQPFSWWKWGASLGYLEGMFSNAGRVAEFRSAC